MFELVTTMSHIDEQFEARRQSEMQVAELQRFLMGQSSYKRLPLISALRVAACEHELQALSDVRVAHRNDFVQAAVYLWFRPGAVRRHEVIPQNLKEIEQRYRMGLMREMRLEATLEALSFEGRRDSPAENR